MIKTSKEPDINTKKFSRQLKELFSDEEIASFILTVVGMSDIAHRFVWEKVKDFMELPLEVKYSLTQHVSFYHLLSLVAQDKLEKKNLPVSFMPIGGNDFQSSDDFEKKFIFVVKNFYEQLKKEGKL